MSEFNEQAHILKMTPHRDKLLALLRKKGIEFSPMDDHLPNVVFTCKGKEVRISHHVFYRFSGICTIRREIGDHEFTWVDVTDDMFMTSYMKSIIEYNFKEELKTVK